MMPHQGEYCTRVHRPHVARSTKASWREAPRRMRSCARAWAGNAKIEIARSDGGGEAIHYFLREGRKLSEIGDAPRANQAPHTSLLFSQKYRAS